MPTSGVTLLGHACAVHPWRAAGRGVLSRTSRLLQTPAAYPGGRGGFERGPERREVRDRRPAPPQRAGDWECPGCGVNNFAFRDACFRCGTAKPSSGYSAARRSDSRAARGGDDMGRDEQPTEWKGTDAMDVVCKAMWGTLLEAMTVLGYIPPPEPGSTVPDGALRDGLKRFAAEEWKVARRLPADVLREFAAGAAPFQANPGLAGAASVLAEAVGADCRAASEERCRALMEAVLRLCYSYMSATTRARVVAAPEFAAPAAALCDSILEALVDLAGEDEASEPPRPQRTAAVLAQEPAVGRGSTSPVPPRPVGRSLGSGRPDIIADAPESQGASVEGVEDKGEARDASQAESGDVEWVPEQPGAAFQQTPGRDVEEDVPDAVAEEGSRAVREAFEGVDLAAILGSHSARRLGENSSKGTAETSPSGSVDGTTTVARRTVSFKDSWAALLQDLKSAGHFAPDADVDALSWGDMKKGVLSFARATPNLKDVLPGPSVKQLSALMMEQEGLSRKERNAVQRLEKGDGGEESLAQDVLRLLMWVSTQPLPELKNGKGDLLVTAAEVLNAVRSRQRR